MTGLDADSRRLLEEILPRHAAAPGASAEDLRAAALALAREVEGTPPEIASVRDLTIAGPGGPLALRVYDPGGPGGARACLVWLHGGGFVTGTLDQHDAQCRRLCAGSGLAVVAVNYRKAPEHPFPAAVLDGFAALEWAAGAWDRVAMGGASAGGNLAAAACLLARDRGGPAIARQLLVYPVSDATMTAASYPAHATGYQLTGARMEDYLAAYAPPGADRRDPLLSPGLAPDLSGLPPAHVLIAEFDPLAAEVARFADRLRDAGVPVRVSHFPGVMHGFFGQPGVIAAARDAMALATGDLRAEMAAKG